MATSIFPTAKRDCRPNANRPWYEFYAMFSDTFAQEVLRLSNLKRGSLVLDPWLGSGTSVAAAWECGYRSRGFDINPVMTIVASGRCVGKSDVLKIIEMVSEWRHNELDLAIESTDALLEWFEPESAGLIRGLVSRFESLGRDRSVFGFSMTCLFEAVKLAAKKFKSKNPTWVKKPTAEERAILNHDVFKKQLLEAMARRSNHSKATRLPFLPRIECGDSRKLPLKSGSVDAVLTSPPYCTRIDYPISTSIELAVLNINANDLRTLRDVTMGSSTIREGAIGDKLLGYGCDNLLEQIRSHASKGSSNYYFKSFYQYFSDLKLSILELNRVLKRSACATIVTQDSYYKGMHIDLPSLVDELASQMNWKVVQKSCHAVDRNMRMVNTKSLKYEPSVAAKEVAATYITTT